MTDEDLATSSTHLEMRFLADDQSKENVKEVRIDCVSGKELPDGIIALMLGEGSKLFDGLYHVTIRVSEDKVSGNRQGRGSKHD